MIMRLDLSGEGPVQPEWPEADSISRKGNALIGRRPYRKLRVMIDSDLLTLGAQRPLTPASLLTELLEHEMVSLFRYQDDGPPADVAPRPGTKTFEGWVVVRDYEPGRGWAVVHPSGPNGWSLSGVIGNAPDIAERDVGSGIYGDFPPAEAARRRRADALAVQVAKQGVHADIFVTTRPYLASCPRGLVRGVTVCGPSQALALLGLYFRAQGEYPVGGHIGMDRGMFFWVAARELLPEGWRWIAACGQHARGIGDDTLFLLALSLPQRVQRALESRDRIHLALNRPQSRGTQDAALAELDVALVLLMGAVDITARVAHYVLGFPAHEERQAGWQRKKWVGDVAETAPLLAAVVGDREEGTHTLDILRSLRNSVHGAALQGVAYSDAGAGVLSLVGVPKQDAVLIGKAMDTTGGKDAWGVKLSDAQALYLDPGVFVDRLFEHVMRLLNALLVATPVERLLHVSLTPANHGPPSTEGPDVFAADTRRAIRWQLGFS